MSTTLIEVRPAKAADAAAVASTHDEAWRSAYQGIIPGAELEKLINRRGPQWWDSAIRKGSRVSVLVFGDKVAGYANYGRNRARSLHFEGEIYELYLRPEFQGLGFGRRLFTSARRDLLQSGLKSMVIWALSDNDPATEFYRALGGRMVARSLRRSSGRSRSTRSPSPGPAETGSRRAAAEALTHKPARLAAAAGFFRDLTPKPRGAIHAH